MSERPLLTVDLDGVICAPPLGVNVGIHRSFIDPDATAPRAFVLPRWVSAPFDRIRFDIRRPLPEAREALSRLHELRRVVLLTGRRSSPEPWLRQYGLAALIDDIVINDTDDSSPHFKLRSVLSMGAAEHIDDDGRTVQLLAQRSPVRVYLRDWPRNRDLPYAPNVSRIADLLELARFLSADTPADTSSDKSSDTPPGSPANDRR